MVSEVDKCMTDKENKLYPQDTDEFIRKYARNGEGAYRFWVGLMEIVGQILFRIKVFGNDSIPEKGPGIICCNHRSWADPAFICAGTKRVMHVLAKRELHDGKFGFIFRAARTIPVDRGKSDPNAFAAAVDVLKQGQLVGIFPEGHRNDTDELITPLKYGAVRMAQITGAPLIPMVIVGKIEQFSDPVTLYFGKPYYVGEDSDLDVENEKLRQTMVDLYLANAKNDDPMVLKHHK